MRSLAANLIKRKKKKKQPNILPSLKYFFTCFLVWTRDILFKTYKNPMNLQEENTHSDKCKEGKRTKRRDNKCCKRDEQRTKIWDVSKNIMSMADPSFSVEPGGHHVKEFKHRSVMWTDCSGQEENICQGLQLVMTALATSRKSRYLQGTWKHLASMAATRYRRGWEAL